MCCERSSIEIMPISNEQQAFLQCLSDHLNQRNTRIDAEIDLDEFYSIAEKHQLKGVISYQIKGPESASVLAKHTYEAVNRSRNLKRIGEIFTNNGVEFIIFKGTEISTYYPIPALRSMGDVDILIHLNERPMVDKLLSELEYKCTFKSGCEWCYVKNNQEVEIHYQLMYPKLVSETSEMQLCAQVWDNAIKFDGTQYRLSKEFHMMYLIVHLKKHLLNSGVGFRQFMDLAVLAGQSLNWFEVKQFFEKAEILNFAQICFALCEKWFDIKIPLSADISGEFLQEATQKIFADGVFGFENDENSINTTANQLKRDQSRLRITITRLFPSYLYMCRVEPFKFVKGKPYLLPLAWFYRFYYEIKIGHARDGLSSAVSPYTKKAELAKREAYLKQWGL